MTHDEFWAKVRAKGPWRIGRFAIRNSDGDCPLRALTGQWGPNCSARLLGLPKDVGWAIAEASDNDNDPHRPLLLRELGLA